MQIAKLFIVGFPGAELDLKTAQQLKEMSPAGVIFFDQNIVDKEQVKKLVCDLKDLLGEDLLISVDQEGGRVQRLRKVTTELSSLRDLAAKSRAEKSLEPLREHAQILSTELKELGFNYNFAPCVDLDSNPANPIIGERSLSNDIEEMKTFVPLLIKEYQRHGILTCAKHFPGHGDADLDSHLDLPCLNYEAKYSSLAEFERHLEPFRFAIEAGVDSIMIGHLLISHLDDKLPASLSPKIIKGLLRSELGFDGVVCSDELTMKALKGFGTYSEICKKALLASNDLLIWNTNLDDAAIVAKELASLAELKASYEASLSRVATLVQAV